MSTIKTKDGEDAMDWALSRYKGGSFRLRYEPVAVIERDTALSS